MPEQVTPSIIRLFLDYADTALWFDGPVGYEGSGLGGDLVVALQSWELFYYEALTPEF